MSSNLTGPIRTVAHDVAQLRRKCFVLTGIQGICCTRPTFLKRYLKWTPLALVIPAVIWAFGHSSYPVFPVYVRGIELTIGGVIFGIFFLRFNIMTCIVAHYVIDAIFFAFPLLKSGNPYYVTSGLIVCLLAAVPFLLGLPGILRKE